MNPSKANRLRALSLLSVLPLVAALAACHDPAKGKAKAVTGEATPQSAPASLGVKTSGAQTYAIEPATSKVQWVGSKVTGKHEGGFKSFTGTASLVDQTPEKSSVNVEIDTKSLHTDDEELAGHLRSADFFDVAKFPKATFTSTEIQKGGPGGSHQVTGNLTLHGVTKAITFPATIRATPTGVEVDAEFAINRKDFGIVYPGHQDDLIRDDVVIKLYIRASKKA